MLELRFPPSYRMDDPYLDGVQQVIAEVQDIRRAQGNRAGNQAIINKIGVDARFVRDEGYWAEALDYHLGLLYGHVGDPQAAALHFERSQTHPASGGDQIFSDHQRDSLELRRRQEAAMERGIPSLVVASMPRSGSASLTQTLATILDAPIMRVSCGHFPNFYLVPRWLNSFSRGGAVLHDHFAALPFNLMTLREGGVRQVFVRIRDPRPAAASLAHLNNRKFGAPDDIDFDSQVIQLCEQAFIPWLTAWIAAASETETGVKIHWLAHPLSELANAAREILSTLRCEHPSLEQYLPAAIPEVRANFVTGDDEAWRDRVGPRSQERLWNAIPQNVRDLLSLRR